MTTEQPRAPHWAFVAPETAQGIRTLLGTRAGDASALLFTAFLLQSPRRRADDDTPVDHVMAPHADIQKCRGLPATGQGEALASGPWLAAYCAHVGTTFVDYKAPADQTGKCRLINVAFLDAQGLRRRPVADAKETYGHVASGLPRAAYAVDERIPFASEVQRDISAYHDALPPEWYAPEEHHFDRALTVSRDAVDDNNLLTVVMGPPRLEAAASGNTERLHAAGYTAMRGEQRRTLWPYWVELDLVSAHAACFARLAKSHSLKTPVLDYLLTFGDAWLATCKTLGLGDDRRNDIKALAIEALFGKAEKNLRAECEARGLPTNIPRSPVFSELIRTRNTLCRIAETKGSLKGPAGRKNELKTTPTALLHSVCSDYEIQLIHPVYAVARRFKARGCYVSLLQHDGVATGAPDDEIGNAFVDACKAAVAAKAEALGVRTQLVVKQHAVQPFKMSEAETEVAP